MSNAEFFNVDLKSVSRHVTTLRQNLLGSGQIAGTQIRDYKCNGGFHSVSQVRVQNQQKVWILEVNSWPNLHRENPVCEHTPIGSLVIHVNKFMML